MSAWEDAGKSLTEAGASLFLEKPFDPYVLEKEIEAIRNTGLKNLPGCKQAGLCRSPSSPDTTAPTQP
jgi:hypothetical protein